MKLVMTLLVRDEEDIVVANVVHHLESGVDHVYVTDNRSVDSTRDLLVPFERTRVVTVIQEDSDDYSQSVWVTRMARMAAEQGADWVINSDADEFWWPTSESSLRAVFIRLPTRTGIVKAHRSDFPPIEPRDPTTPFWEMMIYRKAFSTNALGKPLRPKVAHVARPDLSVGQGNHQVRGLGDMDSIENAGLEILHFPVRSEEQFTNKVVNGGMAYERNTRLDVRVGATWRRLYHEYLAHGLEERYRQEAIHVSKLPGMIDTGVIIEDTRLRRRLRDLIG